MAARPEYEENGVHCSAIINPLAVRTQRVLSFMLRDEWSHFLPESITDLPLVARHASPSEIIILYYLTIPFGIGSYYHLGAYEAERNLRMMIVRAWYSALGLELDDYPGLVHYPENCRYILDVNDFNFEGEYNKLLNRLDYLAKLDTKAYGDGDRSFGCSRG